MPSPKKVLSNLRHLDAADVVTSARYRQQAQALLADPTVSLDIKEAVADRLHWANTLLALNTVGDDSY